jgi:hypothetical protein
MFKRLLVIARDFATAQHWAKDNKLSLGQWVYVSSFHNVNGNTGSEFVKLPGWHLRPDCKILDQALEDCHCVERSENPPSE